MGSLVRVPGSLASARFPPVPDIIGKPEHLVNLGQPDDGFCIIAAPPRLQDVRWVGVGGSQTNSGGRLRPSRRCPASPGHPFAHPYSTVTDFARLRGWSTSVPIRTAVW
jgi:hypothetical protein